MNISTYITEFAKKNHRYKPYSKIYKTMLTGSKPYSMSSQTGYEESEYLPLTIKSCVQAYMGSKDTAIELFKDFVSFLKGKGVDVPPVLFPPVPVSNTFERLMFIAKYLQGEDGRISNLHDILWVSERQIETDLGRLRGMDDPIQICGRKFFIPDTERRDGRIRFQSTAHPLFLAEDLTQILVMLKGLKEMSTDPLYRPYAEETAAEIWEQLSDYAKERIRFVMQELMPEDFAWYESLQTPQDSNRFRTEETVSRIHNHGAGVMLDCIKNGKSFCVEYQEKECVRLYKDCVMEEGGYHADNKPGIVVNCSAGRVRLLVDNVIRSAYTVEELAAE